MITSDYRGDGGQEGPKYDYIIFECSLKEKDSLSNPVMTTLG